MEIWKDIKGYEGLYKVSSKGRILGVKRNKEVKPILVKSGYYVVNLSKNNKIKQFRVQRLVAIAFLPNPCGYPIINHKDENKTNNNVENLEWCDDKYNIEYSNVREYAYRVTRKPIDVYDLNGKFLQRFISIAEAAKAFGIKSPYSIGVAIRSNKNRIGDKLFYYANKDSVCYEKVKRKPKNQAEYVHS